MKMNRVALIVVLAAGLLGGGIAWWYQKGDSSGESAAVATDAEPAVDVSKLKPIENPPVLKGDDFVIGAADAPITMFEYFSLSCSHCAQFHHETFPKIKETYIDTGKVRLVLRDYPLNRQALVAAMIAHCQSPVRYLGIIDYLFQTQEQWAVQDFMAPLTKIANTAGVDSQAMQQCLADEALQKKIVESRQEGANSYQVNGTPAFFINGILVSGAPDFAVFKAVIDHALSNPN